MAIDERELQEFLERCAHANSGVKTRIYPEERARVFQPLLDHILAHPDHRSVYVEAFRRIIFGHRGITDDLVRFCMAALQWGEVAESVRERMSQDIHNSEYNSLEEVLRVYPTNSPNQAMQRTAPRSDA
jgi:hypothetical protein